MCAAAGLREQQRALSEVLQHERRADDDEPVDLDRLLAEMPEVGVERLAAGGDEEDRAEDEKAVHAVRDEEADRVDRD